MSRNCVGGKTLANVRFGCIAEPLPNSRLCAVHTVNPAFVPEADKSRVKWETEGRHVSTPKSQPRWPWGKAELAPRPV